jgi:hypothetical protein
VFWLFWPIWAADLRLWAADLRLWAADLRLWAADLRPDRNLRQV